MEQAVALSGIGCETVQGYLFSRPVTADKIPLMSQQNFKTTATSFDKNATKLNVLKSG